MPVALSIESKGHNVVGCDTNPAVAGYIKHRSIPYQEEGVAELLEKTSIKVTTLDEVIKHSEVVFCPVQTPHHSEFEGITPLPSRREDFDYSYLTQAVKDISASCERLNKKIILVIISTVLPGTLQREVLPVLSSKISLCYNPFFIAMGTTRADFEKPEFVLLGCDNPATADKVKAFYKTIHEQPVFETKIVNAELIKVLYNTFISTKISFITVAQELCHKVGANIDEVSDALSLGTQRIISSKYLRGGMADGGGCHPRDNIALSHIARREGLSYDWFENIMYQREAYTNWLAELVKQEAKKRKLPIVICGYTFKKGTNLTVGSPAILLSHFIGNEIVMYDPYIDAEEPTIEAVYFIGVNHDEFKGKKFKGIVIDPWGIVDGDNVIRVGR